MTIRPTTNTQMKKFVLGIVLLALLVAASLMAQRQFNDGGIEVRTSVVTRGSIRPFITATGNVINREELAIASPVLAKIVELKAIEGEHVGKGKILVRLDDRESRIQSEKSRAALTLLRQIESAAKRDWEHLEQVFRVGGEARKTVDDAKLRWQAAQKDTQVGQEEWRLAQVQLEKFQLSAPLDSTVTSRGARVGVWAKPGDTLFRLAPSGVREIEAKLDSGDSAAARVGAGVTASSDAYPGREWQERITWVAPSTNKDGAANTLNVRVSLGPDAPPLVLGQQADVKIPSAAMEAVLKIPSNAIISRQGKSFVAVIANERVHLLPIAIGIEDQTSTEVKSGLDEGQRIILPEGRTLSEGDKVKLAVERAP